MVYKAKKDYQKTDHRETLLSVPVLADTAVVVKAQEGPAAVKVKVKRGLGFFERFRPPVIEKKFELDELGAFVIELINGQRSILDLVTAFEERFRVNRREAELSVVSFMKMLMQKKIITVITVPQGADS
jgi:hypothetical protein